MKVKMKNNFKEAMQKLENAQNLALENASVLVDGEATVRCPVDTGNLKASMDRKVNEGEKTAYVGNSSEYSPYVEFGTYKMSAQPFLTPAFEENQSKIKRLIKDTIGSEMK